MASGGYGGGMGYGTPGGGMGGYMGGGGGRRLNYNPDGGGYWGNLGGQYGGVPYGATSPRSTGVNPYGGIPNTTNPNAPQMYQGPMRLYEQRAATPSTPIGMPSPMPGPVQYGGPMRLTNQVHEPAPQAATPSFTPPMPINVAAQGGGSAQGSNGSWTNGVNGVTGNGPESSMGPGLNVQKPGIAPQMQDSGFQNSLMAAQDFNRTPRFSAFGGNMEKPGLVGGPTNVYGPGGQSGLPPYDPRGMNYQPGAGWQTMLRRYARDDGAPINQYVQDRGLNPMWGGTPQPWEPATADGSLSEILRRSRSY